MTFEEVPASQCMVTSLSVVVLLYLIWLRLRQHLCEAVINLFFLIYIDPYFLADSPFVDDLEDIVRCFDKTTKLRFGKAEEPQYNKFGFIRDTVMMRTITFASAS